MASVTLDRASVLSGVEAELRAFSALLRRLRPDDLAKPTRCAAWAVVHVAGHVVGTVVDVTHGNLAGQGTPEVTGRQAAERADRTAEELAAELEDALPALTALLQSLPDEAWDGPSPVDPAYTLGFGVEALWYDAFVHGDDVRRAVDLPSARGDGLRCAVHHIAGYLEHRGCRPTTLTLTGMEPIEIAGGGPTATADPLDFVLAATGRADAASLGLDASLNVYAGT